ncbi:MAG: hypothetical protein ACK5NK_07750 [Niabella sp.]
MKTRLLICAAVLINISTTTFAQTLGDFKPGKAGPKSLEKPKFDNKNVYIADFAVNYQVYSEKSASKKGGLGSFGVIGGAKASLAVGLDISEKTLQKITDKVYADFVADLKAQGFNVMSGDEAKNTDFYKGYKYSTNLGMTPSNTMEGAVTVHPQNVGFFYKEKGVNTNTTKLSKELNDATVARIDLYVEFVETRSSTKGGIGANVVARTNLVMSDNNTIAHFIVGRNKIGGSPLGEYQGVLKKDLDIDGVIKEEKITSYVESDYDNWGTSTAFGRVYSAQNKSAKKAAIVPADASKYEKGVGMAVDTFLKHHVSEFKDKFYK